MKIDSGRPMPRAPLVPPPEPFHVGLVLIQPGNNAVHLISANNPGMASAVAPMAVQAG